MKQLSTLRGRLTVASALAVLLSVIGLGVSAELLVSHQIRSTLDNSLRQRAVEVAQLSVTAPAVLTAPGSLEAPLAGTQVAVEVLDSRGRIVVRSLALGARLLPTTPIVEQALRRGRAGFSDVELGAEHLRLYAAPIPDAGGATAGGAVLVAADTSEIETTLHRMVLLLVIAGLVAAVVGALAAAALTRHGLMPLTRLSSAARDIERTSDTGERLPEPATDDELTELARTLNRMMASVDLARRRERRFLADASHELRTPITSLSGNIDFLARHGANAEVIADLQADALRLQQLVEDLLTLEREHGGPTPEAAVNLHSVVADVASTRPEVQAHVVAEATVLGEERAIKRALENLVDNARIHGPPGGKIVVTLAAAGADAAMSVTDDGPGLDPAHIEDAFERFWRAPDAAGRPGSGLGLAIVRATAVRHRGEVEIHGSTVTLKLPTI
jgi:signal transduction histidine kinase